MVNWEHITSSLMKPPQKWKVIYNHVKEMRKNIFAPVDGMPGEERGEKQKDPKTERFHLLIALMLSSQTRDEVNMEAMSRLKTELKGGLNLESVLNTSEKEIDEMIHKVGFHNRKSKYIKDTCKILQEKFHGDVPDTLEGVMSLPGVGPKMAHLFMPRAWGKVEGIGVDVHVHRLAQMWDWVPKSEDPEKTRKALESWLPKELWLEINPMLVGFGQVICKPRAHNCQQCTLAEDSLCKYAYVKPMNVKRTTVKKEVVVTPTRKRTRVEIDYETDEEYDPSIKPIYSPANPLLLRRSARHMKIKEEDQKY